MKKNKIIRTAVVAALMVMAIFVHMPLQAGKHYVGFSSNPSGTNYTGNNVGLIAALAAADADDTVFIARGLTFYLDVELIIDEYVIGGCNPSGDGLLPTNRTAVGKAGRTDGMTVLDGNSLRHTLPKDKHRVAKVESTGCIENCLIRNGHVRCTGSSNAGVLPGYGGGILLNGGKLYNCIIRGNVAMNVAHKSTNPSKGGGVFITYKGGEVVNCIIAFNMDDIGAGIDGEGGKVTNCTVARNSKTPTYVRIAAGVYQPFNGSGTNALISDRYIYLNSFYMSSTETTGGQYACFMAAIDFGGTTAPYLKSADMGSILLAKMPTEVNYTGFPGGVTVSQYVGGFGSCTVPGTSCWNLFFRHNNLTYGGVLNSSDTLVWYPNTDAAGTLTASNENRKRDNYPVSCVSWYGSLAFCLWLGGSLPTEAQWEYAGRQKGNGTTDNNYYYAGATSNDAAGLGAVGWYFDNSFLGGSIKGVHEVGKKTQTGTGLFDMAGNLWEWCIDWFVNSYSNSAGSLTATSGNLVSGYAGNDGKSSSAPLYNPIYVTSGLDRAIRGGNWDNLATVCSLGSRYNFNLQGVSINIGFRSVACP
jgi:formylglycine-generating enzyme required for sulfatase activity